MDGKQKGLKSYSYPKIKQDCWKLNNDVICTHNTREAEIIKNYFDDKIYILLKSSIEKINNPQTHKRFT